jgi:transcriptional repressor NrdR
MKCPFCHYENTFVKDSRLSSNKEGVKRRRYCPKCKERFSTNEEIVLKELFVIKRSGTKKPFDRNKIYSSIKTAMRKRNIDEKQIEKMVNYICHHFQSTIESEIPTRKIGDQILTELAKIDEVAYIRFASVYKDFTSVQDFSKFIKMISK